MVQIKFLKHHNGNPKGKEGMMPKDLAEILSERGVLEIMAEKEVKRGRPKRETKEEKSHKEDKRAE